MTLISQTANHVKGLVRKQCSNSIGCLAPHLQYFETFLGLDHDFSQVHGNKFIQFWARERIEQKLLNFMATAERSDKLQPGVAAKIYGNWGRIGCGGLAPIKHRQQECTSELTEELRQCFHLLKTIIATKLSRHIEVAPYAGPRFLAASDAALETPGQGTGGFLVVWYDGHGQFREAFVSIIPQTVYNLWEPGDRKIAQLELLLRGRRGIWFIDNTAALMALIRGRSDNADLEHMSRLIHVTLFALKAWFSGSGSLVRPTGRMRSVGKAFRLHGMRHGFTTHFAVFPFEIWSIPLPAFLRVVEFLYVLWGRSALG